MIARNTMRITFMCFLMCGFSTAAWSKCIYVGVAGFNPFHLFNPVYSYDPVTTDYSADNPNDAPATAEQLTEQVSVIDGLARSIGDECGEVKSVVYRDIWNRNTSDPSVWETIDEMENFVRDHYAKGDVVLLAGFSSGAPVVNTLARELHEDGESIPVAVLSLIDMVGIQQSSSFLISAWAQWQAPLYGSVAENVDTVFLHYQRRFPPYGAQTVDLDDWSTNRIIRRLSVSHRQMDNQLQVLWDVGHEFRRAASAGNDNSNNGESGEGDEAVEELDSYENLSITTGSGVDYANQTATGLTDTFYVGDVMYAGVRADIAQSSQWYIKVTYTGDPWGVASSIHAGGGYNFHSQGVYLGQVGDCTLEFYLSIDGGEYAKVGERTISVLNPS